MNGYCCGFGHRDDYKDRTREIRLMIGNLIAEKGITVFLTGGMGAFDAAFSSAVRFFRQSNGEVRLILVRPYFSDTLNTDKALLETLYDDIIIPGGIAGCHYKSAITQRNHWMIEQSETVVSGVFRNYGGAWEAVRYAEKLGKTVIRL